MHKEIDPIAVADIIKWIDDLPKTRSGKIMRRILRKIAADNIENHGEISTIADPAVMAKRIEARKAENTETARCQAKDFSVSRDR